MDKYSFLFLILLLSVNLGAQTTNTPTKWAVSLNISSRFSPEIRIGNAYREIAPTDMLFGEADIFEIDGVERRFLRDFSALEFEPADHNFWHATQVQIHHKLNRHFELSGGFLFAQRSFLNQPKNNDIEQVAIVPIVAENYLISAAKSADRHFGLVAHLTYNFLPNSRIRPYVTMGIGALRANREVEILGEGYYTGNLDQQQSGLFASSGASVSIRETNGYAAGGILFQLTKNWGIGIEVNSRIVPASGLVGLQLRYGW